MFVFVWIFYSPLNWARYHMKLIYLTRLIIISDLFNFKRKNDNNNCSTWAKDQNEYSRFNFNKSSQLTSQWVVRTIFWKSETKQIILGQELCRFQKKWSMFLGGDRKKPKIFTSLLDQICKNCIRPKDFGIAKKCSLLTSYSENESNDIEI